MIFVDTGAFLARYHAQDDHHQEALTSWARLERRRGAVCTSNFVLDETFTLLGRRAGHAFAADKARRIYSSPAFTILRPGLEDEARAVELFAKYADQEVSFTDCVSFALMARHRLTRVFGYDGHFARAGFSLWR